MPGNPMKSGLVRILSLVILLTVLSSDAFSRYRFEEGDWIGWADSRHVSDIFVGRETVYIATNGGILRYDRINGEWLTPWLSVPGQLDQAYLLTGCTLVREDPLTLDVYVRLRDGWYLRDSATQRWESVPAIPEIATERIAGVIRTKATPTRNMIFPQGYGLSLEGALQYRTLEWPFSLGAYDSRGRYFYAWEGFGIGIAGEYSSLLELYPGGPGPARAMAVGDQDVWVAATIDRSDGWVWKRSRSNAAWQWFSPDLEWGLEPSTVQRMRSARNGSVWLATDEGVMFGSGSSWRWVRKQDGLPRQRILDIVPAGSDAWIATESGIALITGKEGYVLHPDIDSESTLYASRIDRLASDGDTVWAAGAGILYRRDGPNPWHPISGPSTVAAASHPTALYAGQGHIALGDENGFAWRDSTGEWKQMFNTLYDGARINTIGYSSGYYWLGTNRGLVKFDPVYSKFTKYYRKDGLPGNAVYEIEPEGDWLWLGTDLGLVRFLWYAEGRLD